MADKPTVPRPLVLLTLGLCGMATLLLIWSNVSFRSEMGPLIVVLAALALVSENFAPTIGGYSISLAMPIAVSAMLLQGPVAAALVAGVSAIHKGTFSSRRGVVLTVFNVGQLVLVCLAAGWAYVSLGGQLLFINGPLDGSDFPGMLLPLLAVVIVTAVGNVLMMSAGIAALYGGSFKDALAATTPHIPSFMALVSVGLLMAQVTATETVSLIFFVFPLIVARDLYQRFKSLKDAYADTIRSLIHALEAKDPYTRGHSERVAEYAAAIGRSMGMDARTCERLEYAGLLHDLGKIALPKSLLTKPGSLTDSEMELMKNHPRAGAAMVARIPPLAGLAELVMEHHERFSGDGYPSGKTADSTHLLSRILTVADAYDAMTTNRAYRSAMSFSRAREILLEASGTQFDPQVVAAFQTTWFKDELEDESEKNSVTMPQVSDCWVEGAERVSTAANT